MAFSKAPTQSTYDYKNIQLIKDYNSRAPNFNKDVDYVNVFIEVSRNKITQENMYDIWPRPGISQYSAQLQSNNIRQVFHWEDLFKYYVWIDDDIQVVNQSTGVVEATITGVLSTTSGMVAVTEFLYDTGEVKLVFTDGVDIKTIDAANAVVASTSPDKPANLLTSLVFLDGYLFCVESNSANIVNSNLNDPLAYTAGDFISAEMLPDKLVNISRINNYILAFGQDSIEYFWDAGNATGSPLQRNDTPVKFNGYLGGLITYGNKLYFVGDNTEGSPTLYVVEDFKISEIGADSLRRHLESYQISYSLYNGVILSVNGHDFYLLSVSTTVSFAVDLKTGLWYRWNTPGSNALDIKFSANAKSGSTYFPVIWVQGRQYLDRLNSSISTDYGVAITCGIVSALEDFDVYNVKSMSRLIIVGDRPSTSNTIGVSWTDDDYQTYSPTFSIDMNQTVPNLTQLGSFRRRAFRLIWSPTEVYRIRYLQVLTNTGTN